MLHEWNRLSTYLTATTNNSSSINCPDSLGQLLCVYARLAKSLRTAQKNVPAAIPAARISVQMIFELWDVAPRNFSTFLCESQQRNPIHFWCFSNGTTDRALSIYEDAVHIALYSTSHVRKCLVMSENVELLFPAPSIVISIFRSTNITHRFIGLAAIIQCSRNTGQSCVNNVVIKN